MPREELRRRVLREAGGLFYREGISVTGVNRVASELRVSKRTLYELFDSKDELAAEALADLDPELFTRAAEASAADPVGQLLAIFEVLEDAMCQPGFRGCPYLNAAHELSDPNHPARLVAARRKSQLRAWMYNRARKAELQRPGTLADQLMLVFDGALARATVSGGPRKLAAKTAAQLIQAATAKP